MSTPANYSTAELCIALAAALRATDVLDGTGLDLVTRWQEQAEAMAETIASELRCRKGDREVEERDRNRALASYDDLVSEAPCR